ncbi:hypothetical protein COU62_04175 [Candidatus Pacearchaeota archaeon CG10_big_fil_rev_8_21_14_0_10_35_219]|nr:hypothetical protein [Candidatus Pacearchaeota archaeon]OIO42224.1 MAG: hypothetical protein AUJ63_02995 [Candidatus Pacearchaeota archaeon CG1_02_35_32]PIO07307.1 MAG: hypothetical protein COU62_04175 [Candidatus Pacearchaeota archaeon CG10_big_fil_rev_8_21_14_0_10_35_219]PIY81357.1 MAG: hypothetical protein COY79_03720 [Candidatus Pacearchaeota archaeon CG_4_10_14_0_8_um_filter_35_169]PIZ79813.1 MAG: hypothetical protein COY00_03225 [Candidatus Pacearchaeota archaeon CG_4_10_14_0_2_um_filt
MPSVNKKGLAEVITVVLIITITLAAVAIFYASFMNPVNQLSPAVDCATKAFSSAVTVEKACYNPTTEEIEVQLIRKLQNVEITQIKFTATNEQDSESWGCGSAYTCNFCKVISSGQTKTYFLNDAQLDDYTSISITIDGCPLDAKPVESCA